MNGSKQMNLKNQLKGRKMATKPGRNPENKDKKN